MAAGDQNWEGGCLSEAPKVLPANRFAWYVFQRCSTQWERSQFDGSKMNLKYEVVAKFVEEAEFRGFDFFDQMERIQLIELEILDVESQGREIERERKAAADALKKKAPRE